MIIDSEEDKEVTFVAGNGRELKVKMSGNCLIIKCDKYNLKADISRDWEGRLAYMWADEYIGEYEG